ncbi:MutS 1 [Venturia inaequalis]|nr:MutS 1 [Venturia inaequalis]
MQLNGMYKKKADKIQPQNIQLIDSSIPSSRIDWREFIMKE